LGSHTQGKKKSLKGSNKADASNHNNSSPEHYLLVRHYAKLYKIYIWPLQWSLSPFSREETRGRGVKNVALWLVRHRSRTAFLGYANLLLHPQVLHAFQPAWRMLS